MSAKRKRRKSRDWCSSGVLIAAWVVVSQTHSFVQRSVCRMSNHHERICVLNTVIGDATVHFEMKI